MIYIPADSRGHFPLRRNHFPRNYALITPSFHGKAIPLRKPFPRNYALFPWQDIPPTETIPPQLRTVSMAETFPHPTNQAPEIPLLPMVPASLYTRKLSRRKIHASGTAFSISPRFKLYQLPHLSRIMASAVTTFSMRERTLSTPGCSST